MSETDRSPRPRSNSSGCDEAEDRKEVKLYKHQTEKGRRMAKSVAEGILMKYFMPKSSLMDRKKFQIMKQMFITDM